MSFSLDFDQHAQWRKSFARDLQALSDWLSKHDLRDISVEEQVLALQQRLQADKVLVAFVAEFSRGKSELINALFFSGYGRRIMPASAGRTTMCPTELGYEADQPARLRLLPIRSRLDARTLADWREQEEAWETIPLNLNDAEALAANMARVAEVDRVSPETARALGFWQEEGEDASSPILLGADGLVEVPRWRHALINWPHPLLKQGLVILDTPGLNAIGAEPELTVSLLPQAHAVLFVLGADTGVTASDLKIWQEHLAPVSQSAQGRVVVLNKIDTLWDDGLSSAQQVQQQIDRQVVSSASILGVGQERVVAVSAQKGLLAKINQDGPLLEKSRLPLLEAVLTDGVIGQRRELLVQAVIEGLTTLVAQANQVAHHRVRDLMEQIQELESLRGKNANVIRHMKARIVQEQQEFENGGSRIQAVRNVHQKLLRELFHVLSHSHFRQEVTKLTQKLKEPGLKLGVRKTYEQTFEGLRQLFRQGQTMAEEIGKMLTSSFTLLNTEFGLSLQVPPLPDVEKRIQELNEIEQSHVRYLTVGNTIKLTQPEFCDRLGRALASRLRMVYDLAATDLELWNKTASSQLDAQLRDRRKNFKRRVEAVTRIQDAAGELEGRMQELKQQVDAYKAANFELHKLVNIMADPNRFQSEQALILAG